MADVICIGEETIEEHASDINGAAAFFVGTSLAPRDCRSTISANAGGQEAYGSAQGMLTLFGENIGREAANIRSLGLEFAEYDRMLAGLWKPNARKQEGVPVDRYRTESRMPEEEKEERKP